MSKWLPPAGGGYSGRIAVSGKNATKLTGKDGHSKTGGSSGKIVRSVTPSKGSAGVSRAE